MSPFGLKFSQMILHTETSKLMYMYNLAFLFVALHKTTLLPSTFKSPTPHSSTFSGLARQILDPPLSVDFASPPPPLFTNPGSATG